jgi:hypothetical protein
MRRVRDALDIYTVDHRPGRIAVSDWLRVVAVVLALTAVAAWMERYHPAMVYAEQCGVAGLSVSCGAVAR